MSGSINNLPAVGGAAASLLQEDSVDAPSFIISVGESSFSFTSGNALATLEVIQELSMPAMFRIRFTPSGTEDDFWDYFELEQFKLGSMVQIKLNKLGLSSTLIKGEVTAVEPVVTQTTMSVEIRGFDKMHRLRMGTKSRVFVEVTDSELVSKIAGDWGMPGGGEKTATKYSHLFQNNISDFDFLKSRVERIRYELAIENEQLVLKMPAENGPPVASYHIRHTINSFRASLNYTASGDEACYMGWDVSKKEAIVGKAGHGQEAAKMDSKQFATDMTNSSFGAALSSVNTEPLKDKAEAEFLAKAKFNSSLAYAVTGKGTVKGNTDLVPGKTIKLTGLGRFSGIYYLTKTEHVYAVDQGYTTKFEVRRVGV